MLLMACNMPDAAEDEVAAVILLTIVRTQQAEQPDWEQWVAEHLTEKLAGNLFLAAAARRNTKAMTLIYNIKPGAVPAAAVYAALADAVQQEQTETVIHLCQGAASVCDTASLVSLLLAALEQGYAEGLRALVGLAGQGIEAAQLVTLLHAALKHKNTQFLIDLVQLPAAKQLQQAECAALLSFALALPRKGASGLVPPLVVEVPALSASMTIDHVNEIFKVAAQQRDDDDLLQYTQLSAVQLAAPAQLQQQLLVVLQLLRAALLDHDADVSVDIDNSIIISLLEMSLSRGAVWPGHSGIAALCSLLEQKSAQAGWVGLTCQQAEQLLAHAVPTPNGGSVPGLTSLCSLECVQQAVDSSATMRLLGRALAFGKLKVCRDPAAVMKQLLQLPAAAAAASSCIHPSTGSAAAVCLGCAALP
jgi:hypothetical protein